MKPLKIMVIGRNFPTKENGMTGIFEFGQASAIAKIGMIVYYPAFDVRSIRRWRKWGIYKTVVNGVHVWNCSIPLSPLPAAIRKKIIEFIKPKLYKKIILDEGMPDIIHVHYPTNFPYDVFLPYQKLGSHIVATEHWSKVLKKELTTKQIGNLKQYVTHADAFICVGELLKKSIQDLIGAACDIKVLPNMIPQEFLYTNIKNKYDTTDQRPFIFIVVGRLIKIKQVDKIIIAFAQRFNHSNSVLWILGDGEEREGLEELVLKLGISKQVKFWGLIAHGEVASYIHKSNALICFSRYETFGVPVAEAMCAGKPVIVSKCLGFLEYINSCCGILVDSCNVNELSNAMMEVYSNYADYNPKEISAYGIKYFGEDAVSHQLLDLYLNVWRHGEKL